MLLGASYLASLSPSLTIVWGFMWFKPSSLKGNELYWPTIISEWDRILESGISPRVVWSDGIRVLLELGLEW